MSVNKRLRFEILKRDNFRCTYCGASPKEAELHVDHVIPESLGGPSIAENLTTACADCNSGKASSMDHMVALVDGAVAAAETAKVRVAQQLLDDSADFDLYEDAVLTLWERYVPQYRRSVAGTPHISKIHEWVQLDVPVAVVEFAIRVAVSANVPWSAKAGYVVGIVRNKVEEARYATD